MKMLTGAEIDLLFHGLVNFAVNNQTGFVGTVITDPAIRFTDHSRQAGWIWNDVEQVVDHKSGAVNCKVCRKIGEIQIPSGCIGPNRNIKQISYRRSFINILLGPEITGFRKPQLVIAELIQLIDKQFRSAHLPEFRLEVPVPDHIGKQPFRFFRIAFFRLFAELELFRGAIPGRAKVENGGWTFDFEIAEWE
jgi:hypothetical protein